MSKKPVATLSLDLDNQWSYMKTHGDSGWEDFPSYLDILVPRVLKILDERDLKITFMIVGQDAALEKNRAALKPIADAGHEIGNHSFNHEPWLHLYSREQIVEEFEKSEAAIEEATGVLTRGFRGPGFSLSKDVLGVLSERGYLYDASTFPTFLGPLARAFYFRTTKLGDKERAERKQLFGAFSEGFRPLKPYRWDLSNKQLIEIPVTTLPVLRTPIHFSYLLYLAGYSTFLARIYFAAALDLCRVGRITPSLLLHPLDFLGCNDTDALNFFPAMRRESDWKMGLLNGYLDQLVQRFRVTTLAEFCSHRDAMGGLRLCNSKLSAAPRPRS